MAQWTEMDHKASPSPTLHTHGRLQNTDGKLTSTASSTPTKRIHLCLRNWTSYHQHIRRAPYAHGDEKRSQQDVEDIVHSKLTDFMHSGIWIFTWETLRSISMDKVSSNCWPMVLLRRPSWCQTEHLKTDLMIWNPREKTASTRLSRLCFLQNMHVQRSWTGPIVPSPPEQ